MVEWYLYQWTDEAWDNSTWFVIGFCIMTIIWAMVMFGSAFQMAEDWDTSREKFSIRFFLGVLFLGPIALCLWPVTLVVGLIALFIPLIRRAW